jgi:hypothetical protein
MVRSNILEHNYQLIIPQSTNGAASLLLHVAADSRWFCSTGLLFFKFDYFHSNFDPEALECHADA